MSKHETGIVTQQTTGALQFMFAFALRGGGGCYTSANISHFVVPWEAGGPSPNQDASDHTMISSLQGGTAIGALGPAENFKINQDGVRSSHVCPTEVGKIEANREVQQAYAVAACARKYVQQ